MLNRVLKTGMLSVLFSGVQALISLFIAGYSLKVLGVEFIGRFQLVQAIYLFIFPFLGLPVLINALINYVAEKSKLNEMENVYCILETSLGFFIVSNLILSFGVFAYLKITSTSFNDMVIIYLLCAILVALFEQLQTLFSAYFSGRSWFVLNQFLLGIFGVAFQVAVFLAVYIYKVPLAYVLTMLLGTIVKVVVSYILIAIKEKRLFLPSFRINNLLKMPMFSRSAYIGTLSTPFLTQGDRLILSFFGGIGNLPFYTISQRALIFVHSIIYNVTYTLFPILSSEGLNAIQKAKEIDARIRWAISFISTVLYGSVMLVFPTILSIVAGKEIGSKALVFIVLASINGVFVSNSTVASMSLMGLKKVKLLAINSWMNNILILLLLFVFSSIWGAVGTALAKLGNIFQMLFTNFYYSEEIGLKGVYKKYRPFLSSIIVFTIFVFAIVIIDRFNYSTIIEFFSSLIFYFLILLLWVVIDYQTETGKAGVTF